MKEILGKKLGMTRVFAETGEAIPVTVIQAGPCPVVAKRTMETHGYEALQIGFGEKTRNVNKPMTGHFAKAGVEPTQHLREVKFEDDGIEVGQVLTVGMFKVGQFVDVSGISRGLGFAGGMKRHHFQGAQVSHGQSDRLRAPGSIGQSSYPSRVFKGQRMAGRLGKDMVSALRLRVVKVIENENLLLVRGSVPGHRGSLLKIRVTNRGK